MKIATWSIVNNEEDFIEYIIDYHMQFVDGMYISDNGSTDNTWDILLSAKKKYKDKLFIEKYPIKYTPEYNLPWEEMKNPFDEVTVRNDAIKRCKEIFSPDWLIQLDGDELFLPSTVDVIKRYPNALSISHSTLNPVGDISTHPTEKRFGMILIDPHARIWNTKYQINYMRNKAFQNKTYHCIPVLASNSRHLFENAGNQFVNDKIHLHLHWLYGRKLFEFYKQKGITDRNEMKQQTNQFYNLLPQEIKDYREVWFNKKI